MDRLPEAWDMQFAKALYEALRSSDDKAWDALRSFGVNHGTTAHHSAHRRWEVKAPGFANQGEF